MMEPVPENLSVDVSEEAKTCAPAIYSNSHVLEQYLEEMNELVKENQELKSFIASEYTTEKDEEVVINGWTLANTETVKKWQLDIEHTNFIYGEVLLGVKKKLNFIMVTALVLSVISAFFAGLNLTLSFLGQKWVGIAFEILILVSTATSAILTGLIPIFGLERKLEDFTRFTEKLSNAWFIFQVELGISPDQRINAHDFIKRLDGQYLSLMQQCPFLDVEQYQKANYSYKERLFQDSTWTKNLIKSGPQQ